MKKCWILLHKIVTYLEFILVESQKSKRCINFYILQFLYIILQTNASDVGFFQIHFLLNEGTIKKHWFLPKFVAVFDLLKLEVH
jgi:hypothetical protein